MKTKIITVMVALATAIGSMAQTGPRVATSNGVLEGTDCSGVKVFKGVAFAQPPVGQLRWKAPQPVENWTGVRSAKDFGPNPMQQTIFGAMMFG